MEKAFPKETYVNHKIMNKHFLVLSQGFLNFAQSRMFAFLHFYILYECCFCYTHHFGAIGYTRWHRDQLDRGRVYQLLVKTSTLRLAHMMYPCLPWFNNNTLGVPELGRPPVIHVISIWFSDPWNKPSSYWGTPRFYRFWVPVSGQPPAGTSCCKEAMLPHHHHHHDRCTVTVYKHL